MEALRYIGVSRLKFMKYYVVSDVHGFYTELKNALTEKGYFSDSEPHKLIVCGDVFDRGKEALKMQEFICDLLDKDEVILIKGNHEDLVLDLLDYANEYFYNKVRIPGLHHYRNGTIDTMVQLTGLSLNQAIFDTPSFVEAARRTPFISKIIPAMSDYFETDNYIFVHGWIPCTEYDSYGHYIYKPYEGDWRKADSKEWEKARWYNGMLCACDSKVLALPKTIVCGHWHCSFGHYRYGVAPEEFGKYADFSPFCKDGIIAIDACTAYSGKVNCIIVTDTITEK